MVIPAALVGPEKLSEVSFLASPGLSSRRTSIEVALGARTYMKL